MPVGELLVAERLIAADELPGELVAVAAGAQTVLHGGDLRVEPGPHEVARDAAVVGRAAQLVVERLPRDDRGQVRRLPAGHQPLHHAQVDIPSRPTFPVDHGWPAAHSTASW